MTLVPVAGIEGRVAVVTGGASGIGGAIAHQLEAAGAKVAVIDLAAPDAGVCDLSLCFDVGDPDAVSRAFAQVEHDLGPPTLAVHAAGIRRDAVVWKATDADWEQTLRVNLSGAFYVLREMAPRIRAAEGGGVVLIGSINGIRGKFGQAAYTASKAGLEGLAKTVARELGKFGGRVNVVAPGLVETPMIADLPEPFRQKALEETVLGRLAEPQDVASVVRFLLSDDARHVTGQSIRVDGGQHM